MELLLYGLYFIDENLIACCRPPTEFIPPVQEPYQYIIFRASEVKDLSVDEPAPLRSVHDDPAVLGVCHSLHHVDFHILSSSIPHSKYNNIPGKTPRGATQLNFSVFSLHLFIVFFRTDKRLDTGVCTHSGEWLFTISANDCPTCASTATSTAAIRPTTTAAAVSSFRTRTSTLGQ